MEHFKLQTIQLILTWLIDNTLASVEFQLVRRSQSQSNGEKCLLSDFETLRYSSDLDITGRPDAAIRITVQRENENDFSFFCAFEIPRDCDSMLDHECSCVTVSPKTHYQLNTNITATTSLSNALIRGELHFATEEVYSNTARLPAIFDTSSTFVNLQFEGTSLNLSDCKIKSRNHLVTLLFRCNEDSPSSCLLNISDVLINKTLVSDYGAVLYSVTVETERTLTFSYTICNFPNFDSFQCKIESVYSGEKVGLDSTLYLWILAPVTLIAHICILILFKRRFNRVTQRHSKAEGQDVSEAEDLPVSKT